jgi:hypothetical protein
MHNCIWDELLVQLANLTETAVSQKNCKTTPNMLSKYFSYWVYLIGIVYIISN